MVEPILIYYVTEFFILPSCTKLAGEPDNGVHLRLLHELNGLMGMAVENDSYKILAHQGKDLRFGVVVYWSDPVRPFASAAWRFFIQKLGVCDT